MAKLPKFETRDELVAFWDTHDFTDYLDEMEEVDLDRFTRSHTGVAPYPLGQGLDAAIEGDCRRAGPVFQQVGSTVVGRTASARN